MGYIYVMIFDDGSVYVGQTIQEGCDRIQQHLAQARRKIADDATLTRLEVAIDEQGENAMRVEVRRTSSSARNFSCALQKEACELLHARAHCSGVIPQCKRGGRSTVSRLAARQQGPEHDERWREEEGSSCATVNG